MGLSNWHVGKKESYTSGIHFCSHKLFNIFIHDQCSAINCHSICCWNLVCENASHSPVNLFSLNSNDCTWFRRYFAFLFHFSVSGLQASVFSYVSEFHTEDTAPRATSFASMFIPLMNIYVAIVGYFIIPIDLDLTIFDIKFSPWRIFMILMALVNLFSSIVFIYLPVSQLTVLRDV